jgi:glycosyltransferase involved in cell wall biosynthesis
MEKKISIITPVFNGEEYIESTIQSVISQTYNDIEYIIVDGGSTDRTKEIIEKYRSKVSKIIYQNDNTMYEAIETGFKLATGEYYYWINSDDFLIDDNSVKRLMKIVNKKNYDWVTCNIAISKFNNKPKIYFPLIYPRWIIKKGWANNCFWGFIQQENTIFSKNLYQNAKGIDPKFKMAGDYDLWKRFAQFKRLIPLNINFACFRKHNNQLQTMKKYYEEMGKKQCKFNIFYPLRIIISLLYVPFLLIKN